MSQRLFDLAFPLAAPFWALMIVAPTWSWTRRIAGSPLIVLPALLVYPVAVLPVLPELVIEVSRPEFAGLRDLLGTDHGTAGAWAHMIAFDLFVGRWIYLDSRQRQLHPLIMAPVLVLTILLAPIGLGAYLAVRAVGSNRRKARPGTEEGAGREPAVTG
jgi:hypothetical protein